MQEFNSYEDAMAAAKSKETDPEVIQDIISGNISIVSEAELPPENQEEVAIEPAQASEKPVVETPSSEVSDVPLSDEAPKVELTPEEIAQSLYDEAIKKSEEAHQTELQELRDKIEAQRVEHQPQVAEETKIEIPIDDDDSDLASAYEKKTRQLMKAVLEKVEDPTLKNKIEENEKMFDSIRADKLKELEKIKHEGELQSICQEVDELITLVPALKLPVATRKALQQSNELKQQIAKVLGITDNGKLEGAYRRIIRGDSEGGKRLRTKLENSEVKIPDHMGTYLDIVELDEYRNGIQFNSVTNKIEDRPRSLKEAYLAKNYSSTLKEEVSSQVASITSKLQGKANSATTVLDVEVIETQQTEADTMAPEEAIALIKGTKLSDLENNKELAKQFAKAYQLAKVPLPEQAKQYL